MATWTKATELSRRYLVGSERLLEYSARGNLPMSRASDGTALFDEDIVARLFRARQSSPSAVGSSLGVLGSTTLGTVVPALELGQREQRRREIWRARGSAPTEVAPPPRRNGTTAT